jgi:Flp pilus assembly protein TadG
MTTLLQRGRTERGAALLEMALTLPLLLLVCVGILEFGRAYQTWQVITNAAREGARIAVLPGMDDAAVRSRVQQYMTIGQLPRAATASITIDRNQTVSIGGTGTASASQVTVNYPFDFVVLDPIARLATGQGSATPSTLNMVAQATMRNES